MKKMNECLRCTNKRTEGIYCDTCAELVGLEKKAEQIGKLIQNAVDSTRTEYGFLLMLFNFGEGGNLTYISNAQRGDMTKAVKEWLAKEGVTEQ